MSLTALVIAATLTAEPGALLSARRHLDAGQLDELLFDLQDAGVDPRYQNATADVLAHGASASLARKDDLLALQLAQMALRQQPAHALANETAARAALSQQQFEAAERYADAWVDSSATPAARLFRAQLALEQADWAKVLAVLDESKLSGDDLVQAKWMRGMAQAELEAKQRARTDARILEQVTNKAAEDVRAMKPEGMPLGAGNVTLYWDKAQTACGEVLRRLKSRNLSFIEKHVKRDGGDYRTLDKRLHKVGRGGLNTTVCYVDIRDTLYPSYELPQIEQALQQLVATPR